MAAKKKKIGKFHFSRDTYKKVKKMDRDEMEDFLLKLYEEGQQSILKTRNEIDFEDVRVTLMEIKGIGQKRADQIMIALEERIERKKNNE